MGENEDGFEGDQEAGSFSQLLFSDQGVVGLDDISLPTFKNFSPSSFPAPVHTNNTHPKMLCFGDYQNNELLDSPFLCCPGQQQQQHQQQQKSVVACSAPSSASSCRNSKAPKKRNGLSVKPVQGTCTASGGRTKKSKPENPAPGGHAKVKVRKEKLGERISTLQQLVSPFGKTDTASVLHEAMGYIKFLQDQVQVLCSPYLLPEHLPRGGGDETGKDLRSRGLCLVPLSCTVQVANTNGADFWSPAAVINNSSYQGTDYDPSS